MTELNTSNTGASSCEHCAGTAGRGPSEQRGKTALATVQKGTAGSVEYQIRDRKGSDTDVTSGEENSIEKREAD
jgi:hypothetical protein